MDADFPVILDSRVLATQQVTDLLLHWPKHHGSIWQCLLTADFALAQ